VRLSAVFFDIDDTLFSSSSFAVRARRSAVEAMVEAGLEVSADQAYAELEQVVREFTSNYGHHYDKLILRLHQHLRPGVHPALVVAAGVVAYHTMTARLEPFPDAVRALADLGTSELILGVISNGFTVKQAEKLVRLGLQHAFSPGAFFISEEIGVAKPHPRVFLLACEALGIPPGEALYVGDDSVKDVDPAHEAGLLTCLRRGAGKHAEARGAHAPDFIVDDLGKLVEQLRARFTFP